MGNKIKSTSPNARARKILLKKGGLFLKDMGYEARSSFDRSVVMIEDLQRTRKISTKLEVLSDYEKYRFDKMLGKCVRTGEDRRNTEF